MKNRNLAILSAVTGIVLVSLACMPFTPAAGPLKFEPGTLPPAQTGAAYEIEIRITQNRTPAGDIFISKGALPAGLELVKVQGEDAAKISGAPEAAGTFTFTVSAWCYGTNVSGQTGEKEYSIVVQ